MKKIEAFIRPEKIVDIKDMLVSMHIGGLSVSEVMGCGNQKGWKNYVRGSEVDVNFLPKLKIELVVRDEHLEDVVNKICEISKTGEVGDGKIFVIDVQESIRIRTGEKGDSVL